MKINDALNILNEYGPWPTQMGLAPPTQLAPYRDLNYMMKHWAGTRPEYKPKKDYINNLRKKKKKKKSEEPEEVKSSVTIEQYNVQRTRDVAPNYLVRALTPFFYMTDEPPHEPKKNYFNKTSKKKKKKKPTK